MTLKEQISNDFMTAYKAKDMKKKDFLGVLKGAIQNQEGKQIESTDENVLKVIKSMEKGVNETLESLKSSGADISEQEAELTYLKPYLPELMSETVVREKVRLIILEAANKNVGVLMGMFNKQNAGLAFDNKLVSSIFKEEIA
jgi:uncharacterized protein YqeY